MNNRGLYVAAFALLAILVVGFVFLNVQGSQKVKPFTGQSLLKVKTQTENTGQVLDYVLSDALLSYVKNEPGCNASLANQPGEIAAFFDTALTRMNQSRNCSYSIDSYNEIAGGQVDVRVTVSCNEQKSDLAVNYEREFTYQKQSLGLIAAGVCTISITDRQTGDIDISEVK
jgi:hypothetical protein